ncbi:FecR family protein [Gaoshiqia sp. Z1-71]|uniref:FecR family protein n=1 Tax=Gaoshiqia hydrogeniformans TaxID=3290090 RepID=UPI003BF92886
MKDIRTDKKALDQFVEGNYSRTEYRRVKELFAQDSDAALQEAMQTHWDEIPANQPLNRRLKQRLNSLLAQVTNRQPSKKTNVVALYQRVAAILFIPMVLAMAAYWLLPAKPEQTEALATIHSPDGSRTEFVLPDGTTGWLNSGSKLSYPVTFHKSREVELTGEAYFQVVRRDGKKFRVKTPGLTVQVMGTAFNVAAYPDDKEINVVLEKGQVQILSPLIANAYTMQPDEKFNFNLVRNQAQISKVNAVELTSWTQGILRFNGEPLSEVMKKLARWYNVDFEIRDEQLRAYNFKATFKNEQLEEILRMIALTTPMKYRIEQRKPNYNGIYMKKKIIIEGR